ncbi:MAG: hypothetical protein NTW28_09510 [Candidatus Solibacter sp.]|nr:hypothetical protein [Candidatus Solibacter sp.]
MGMLDGIAGGLSPMSMMPGGDVLAVVSKGLDLIKQLMDQNNTGGADAILKFLSDIVGNMPKDASQAADPQPFTAPPQSGAHEGQTLSIDVNLQPSNAQITSHDVLPSVDGSAQGDQALSNSARPFVEGSESSKSRALAPGSNEWTAVLWAMQQNPNIRYDADAQRFFVQMSDGGKRDVCSLQDVNNVASQNGGFDRNHPTAAAAIGDFLKNSISSEKLPNSLSATISIDLADLARSGSGSGAGANQGGVSLDDLNAQIDELKKKLKMLEQANQVMHSGNAITVTVAS